MRMSPRVSRETDFSGYVVLACILAIFVLRAAADVWGWGP